MKAAESTVWGAERSQQRRSPERRKGFGSGFYCSPCHLSLITRPFYRSWRGSEEAKVTLPPPPAASADFNFCLWLTSKTMKAAAWILEGRLSGMNKANALHSLFYLYYISIPKGDALMLSSLPLDTILRKQLSHFVDVSHYNDWVGQTQLFISIRSHKNKMRKEQAATQITASGFLISVGKNLCFIVLEWIETMTGIVSP